MSTPIIDPGLPVSLKDMDNTIIDTKTIVLETATSIGLFYTLFKILASYTTHPRFCQSWQIDSSVALDVANKSISALFATISTLTGIYCLLTYGGHYYTDKAITYMMPLAMGYFLYDMYAMHQVYRSKISDKDASFWSFMKSHPLMTAHHLSLSLFFIPIMINNRDHTPGDPMLACALIMEASTPFVSLRAILYNLHLRHSMVYVVNGLVMVLAFLSCRILIVPWFYYVYASSNDMTMLQAIKTTPLRCASFMAFAFLPQLYWFRMMVLGAMKVVMEKFNTGAKTDVNRNDSSNNHDTKANKSD